MTHRKLHIESFDDTEQQYAADLGHHAVMQYCDLFKRTIELTSHPLADVLIARDLCLAAVTSSAGSLIEAARQDGVRISLEDAFRLTLEQLHKDTIRFVEGVQKHEAKS